MRFLLQLVVTGVALWVTTLLVTGVKVIPFEQSSFGIVATYAIVAAIFGLINSTVGVLLKIVSFPLYVITLGLFSFIVNGVLFLIVAWVSGLLGFGLAVSGFWVGVWGAIVLAVFSWLIGLIVRPKR